MHPAVEGLPGNATGGVPVLGLDTVAQEIVLEIWRELVEGLAGTEPEAVGKPDRASSFHAIHERAEAVELVG